jgi:hypothetical protein
VVIEGIIQPSEFDENSSVYYFAQWPETSTRHARKFTGQTIKLPTGDGLHVRSPDDRLGFEVVDDAVFRDLVVARIVEPTSKADFYAGVS